jgi:hypothetical protein
MSDIIKLNVGGKKFMTTLSTLRLRGPNMLATMIENDQSGSMKTTKDDDGSSPGHRNPALEIYYASRSQQNHFLMHVGYYFIDRNGETFGIILDYLRTGKLLGSASDLRDRHDQQIFDMSEELFCVGAKSLALSSALNSPDISSPLGKWVSKYWPKMKNLILQAASEGKFSDQFIFIARREISIETSEMRERFRMESKAPKTFKLPCTCGYELYPFKAMLQALAAHLTILISLEFRVSEESSAFINMAGTRIHDVYSASGCWGVRNSALVFWHRSGPPQ